MRDLAKRCKAARVKAGLSQQEAAYKVRDYLPGAISDQKIARLEAGQNVEDVVPLVAALSIVYGTSIDRMVPAWFADEANRYIKEIDTKRAIVVRACETPRMLVMSTQYPNCLSDYVAFGDGSQASFWNADTFIDLATLEAQAS